MCINHKKNTPGVDLKKTMLNHEKKVSALKDEVDQLKVLILQMGGQITILHEEIQKGKQSNIEEVVMVVVNMLNKPTNTSFDKSNNGESITNCDQCEFQSQNKNDMIKHISKSHKYCPSCDLCGVYFGNKKLIKKKSL